MIPAATPRMDALARRMAAARIVPVLTIERAGDAVPLARALVAGGLAMLEVTLRTAAAWDALRAIRDEIPQALAGIGTVLDPADLERAQKEGAAFAVSPGASDALLNEAASVGIPFLPGVATPSEMMRARERGFALLKLFPAEQVGGVALLRAVGAPFADLRFCPTGGIGESNLSAYLALRNVVAVGGSWMVPREDVAAGAWQRITERARQARNFADAVRPG